MQMLIKINTSPVCCMCYLDRSTSEAPDTTTGLTFDKEASTPPYLAFDESVPHKYWFWQLVLLLVSWLHLFYHLSHAACMLILKTLQIIFIGVGILKHEDDVPISLRTVFRRLGLVDEFEVHAMCETCRWVYPPDFYLLSLNCTYCNSPLYSDVRGVLAPSSSDTPMDRPLPRLRCPQYPLSSSIVRFVWDGSNEVDSEVWRLEPPVSGVKSRIQDGRVWKSLPASDGELFFDNSPNRKNPEELRLGITIGFDGYGCRL